MRVHTETSFLSVLRASITKLLLCVLTVRRQLRLLPESCPHEHAGNPVKSKQEGCERACTSSEKQAKLPLY